MCSRLVRRRATLPGPGWVQVPSLLAGLTSVFGMGTGVTPPLKPPAMRIEIFDDRGRSPNTTAVCVTSDRRSYIQSITHNLNLHIMQTSSSSHGTLQRRYPEGRSIELLVPLGSNPHGSSTCGLSTSWSRRALYRTLILRTASRLYAFSVYPCRT